MDVFNFSWVELFALAMFFLGMYGLFVSKNVIKSIVFVTVLELAVVMYWLGLGYRAGIAPPIQEFLDGDLAYVADPLPQALMITAIIIGMSVTAANIVMLVTLVRKLKTTEWDKLKLKSMEDE